MVETQLEPQEVARRVEEGWQLIDVRPADERGGAHIAGDRQIELEELPQRAGELEGGPPVIFYCRVGRRSAMAVDALRGAGREAFNLAGGIEAWQAAGLPVEQDS